MRPFHSLVLAIGSTMVITIALPLAGAVLEEDFSANPFERGWHVFGDTNLFSWNASEGNLRVTWDSRQTNSYFYRPLGTILSQQDSFSVAFDLHLTDLTPNIDPNKTNAPFQIAVGLIRIEDATSSGFVRGSGFQSPNLVEFDFFPDPGGNWQWGPSLTAIICDRTGLNWSSGGFAPAELTLNDVFRITMTYDATNQTLTTVIMRNGEPFLTIPPAVLGTNFTELRVDAVAVCSYSDVGQWPGFEGSILAHGSVDNFVLTLPPPPVRNLNGIYTNSTWKATFLTTSNWVYTWEISTNLADWEQLSTPFIGTGERVFMEHFNPPSEKAFYRVRAQRP